MSAVLKDIAPRLQPMQEKHLSAIMEIELSAYTHPWTEAIFLDCLRVGYCCWVMEKNNSVIGYGVMSVGVDECHMLNICIKPELQGNGYGKIMLDHLLDTARTHKASTAFLEVRPSNHVAINLYEQAGFNEVGMRRNYYPAVIGREDALILALSLQ